MGETLRRYWLPALLSEELPEPDCPPVQLKLLGESLVAFRDSDGRVGVLDEFCPHRGVSLWLGRCEEGGLRCVYHGWKFDVQGNCLDQMNEPESFAHKVRALAYPAVEIGGLVWVYMGPSDKAPPLPKFEWTQVPASHRNVTKTWEECNWLQALEGGIDTSHFPILHRSLREDTTHFGIKPSQRRSGPPQVEVTVTDYGFRYAGIRALSDGGGNNVRGYHYVLPFTQIRPPERGRHVIPGHFWVPLDDENCMVYNWLYSCNGEPLDEDQLTEPGSGRSVLDVDPAAGYRKLRNPSNRWLIDRAVQRTETFTGIDGINTQDHAVQESMGTISDRSKEHLGPTDRAIIVARQLLLKAVHTVEDGGDPQGTSDSYYHLRSAERNVAADADWWAIMKDEMYPEGVA
jgi:phthalate 4,5-dioxygenase